MIVCKKCGVEKPSTEYYRHKNTRSGLLGHCKACHEAERRLRNAETAGPVERYVGYEMTIPQMAEEMEMTVKEMRNMEKAILKKLRIALAGIGVFKEDVL